MILYQVMFQDIEDITQYISAGSDGVASIYIPAGSDDVPPICILAVSADIVLNYILAGPDNVLPINIPANFNKCATLRQVRGVIVLLYAL